ncbi:unnamed protein product [Mytilus coruscus]|uniref:G-protein coupled receptors family 1 profile domain-containing protein n=1 Tax=Mytilus coruscus TaxID=42192 RepID=A0A6J8DMW9_MYTCO|nr:unnamed protein product [Mytilus coruscus]
MNSISETSPSIVLRNTNDSIDANITECIPKNWAREVHKNIIANAVVLSLYFVIGITGNALVLAVYKTQLRHASVERYFIPVLAISDMLSTICGSINNMAGDLMSDNFTNNALCKYLLFTISNTAYMSVLLLLCIAFQRYLLICQHHSLSLKHRHLMVDLSFVFADGLALPFAFFYGVNDFYNDGKLIRTQCGRLKTSLYLPGAIYAISFVSLMVLTVLALIFFYGRIACTVFEHLKSKRSKKYSLDPLSKGSNNKYRLDTKDNTVDRHSHNKTVHQENNIDICVKDKEIKIIQQTETSTWHKNTDRNNLGENKYHFEDTCNELQRKPEMLNEANIIDITNDAEVVIKLKRKKEMTVKESVDIESFCSEGLVTHVENANGASKLWIELPDFQQNSENYSECNTFEAEYKFENNRNREATMEKENMYRDNQIQIFIQDIDDQSIDNASATGVLARKDIRKANFDKANAEHKSNLNLCLKVANDQSSDISSGSESRTDITNITPHDTPMRKASAKIEKKLSSQKKKSAF